MTTFNTGSQQAGIVNMVGGNQYLHGGQHAYPMTPPEVLTAIETLREHLAELLPDPTERGSAGGELHHLTQRLATGHATKAEAVSLLSRIIGAAQATGTIVSAATKVGAAITTLAQWLGPAGMALTHIIH